MITKLRRLARATLPEGPRLAVAYVRRGLRDRLSGDARRMAGRNAVVSPGPPGFSIVEVVQEIRGGAFAEGKVENIRLGVAGLDNVAVAPGDIFSFWALLGCPSAKVGFRLGRSIRNGVVAGEIGGGLCQLSGIAYELGLRAGLDPLERHAHSHDLYTEEERFTPLGLDATVVWPYKDLRLANPFNVPVTLRFAMHGMTLSASLHASRAFEPLAVEIERIDHEGHRAVTVSRRGQRGLATLVGHDIYAVAKRQ